jgi:hypothetical protein
MHGVTTPLTLTIANFLCQPDPIVMKEVCGADAYASFNRKDFGVDWRVIRFQYGGKPSNSSRRKPRWLSAGSGGT